MEERPDVSKRKRTRSTSTVSGPRVTQRVPLSCTECSRRKIKCDRSIPCRPCLDRGEDLGCQLEEVAIRGELRNAEAKASKRMTFNELQLQVDELSRRVKDLEQGVGASRMKDRSATLRCDSPLLVDPTRLPGVIEEAALGIGETSRWKKPGSQQSWETGGGSPWFTPKTLDDCLTALPSQAQVRSLVSFYVDKVAWLTGSVDISTLLSDQERFWIQLEAHQVRDDIWLSLYFALISVAAFFIEEPQATSMYSSISQVRHLGLQCFDAAIATIYRCDGATHPSVVMCQAVQTLGPSFHYTSNTMLHRSLVAVITSHARSLNLHVLGPSQNRGENDNGRHVWWNLVEPDWAFLPYNRYCTIFLHQFTSAMSTDDLHSPPLALVYRTVCFRAARVLFDLFGELSTNQDPSYEAVTAASNSLYAIRDDHNRTRLTRRDDLTSLESDAQQHLIDMTLAYREYQCHRVFFVRAITDHRYTQSYTVCINAAKVIFSISSRHLPESFLILWNVTVMVVAAGIILALDHAFKPGYTLGRSQADDTSTVSSLVNRLRRLQDPSGIASRGATLIQHLLSIKRDETITREAIQQLVTVSRDPPMSGGFWPQMSSIPRSYELQTASFPYDQTAMIASDIGQTQQTFWDNTIDDGTLYQDDIDLDFARLLNQITSWV